VSEEQRAGELRFSRGGRSVAIGLFGLLIVGSCLYIAADYAFGNPPERHGTRYSSLWNFFRDGHEWMAVVLFLGLASPFAWPTFAWFWGFFTNGAAAELTDDSLRLHRSNGRRTVIPYDSIESIDLRHESGPMLFGLIRPMCRLVIRTKGGKATIRSVRIAGGGEALEAFAAELNARRTIEGRTLGGMGTVTSNCPRSPQAKT
jgi:hypothetical protein